MSDAEPPKPTPTGWAKRRLPFDDKPNAALTEATKKTVPLFYGAMALGLAGLAVFMSAVQHMPLMSAYVIAPAIGAAWFGLRVFMMLNPRDK